MLEFDFLVSPIVKKRPRVFKTSYGTKAITPKITKQFENHISFLARKEMKKRDLLTDALKVKIEFFLKKPKSSKNEFPKVRPDLDNYVKSVFDAFDGIVWKDDGQVCEIEARKLYTEDKAHITVRIETLE